MPCDECRSCLAFLKNNHVDVRRISPAGPSRITKVEKIASRQPRPGETDASLELFFRTPPLLAKRKVAVIQDAERMNGPAANAILKMLEEPHPYAKLILATNSLRSVIA